MTSALFVHSPAHTASIVLSGIRWPTFQALIADLKIDTRHQLTYRNQQLEVSNLHPNRSESALVQLTGISWSTYTALMSDVGEHRAWRIAYDQGVLELRMPRIEHEEPKELLGDFISIIVDELEVEMRKLGALTLERDDLTRAVEPDACFYIQNEAQVRGRSISLPRDPPPDLVIESDHTHSSLNKHSIYAALGVPEIWRYHQKKLTVYCLSGADYMVSPTSLAFPWLPIAEIAHFIAQSQSLGQRTAGRQFRVRIRTILDDVP